jgi:hypothetical protein
LLRDRLRLLEAKRMVLLWAIATGGQWLASDGSQWLHPFSSRLQQSGQGIRTIQNCLSHWEMSNTMRLGACYSTEGPLGVSRSAG